MSSPQDQTLDFNALVAMITESVLGRLSAGTTLPPPASSGPALEPTVEARRLTWVLAAPCGHLAALCRELSVLARLGHRQRVVACPDVVEGLRSSPEWPGEGPGVALTSMGAEGHGLSGALSDLADQELIYVGSLGWHQVSALAALDDRDAFVQLLLFGLSAGKPVSLLAGADLHGVQGLAPGNEGNAPPALARRAQGLWRELAVLGVQPLQLSEIRRPLAAIEAAGSPQGRAFGGLLTERDIEEAAAAGLRELRLSRATLVTPLARDRARALDVRIEQV